MTRKLLVLSLRNLHLPRQGFATLAQLFVSIAQPLYRFEDLFLPKCCLPRDTEGQQIGPADAQQRSADAHSS